MRIQQKDANQEIGVPGKSSLGMHLFSQTWERQSPDWRPCLSPGHLATEAHDTPNQQIGVHEEFSFGVQFRRRFSPSVGVSLDKLAPGYSVGPEPDV